MGLFDRGSDDEKTSDSRYQIPMNVLDVGDDVKLKLISDLMAALGDEEMRTEVAYALTDRAQEIHENPDDGEWVAESLRDLGQNVLGSD